MRNINSESHAGACGRAMWLALAQAIACSLSLGGCGGGGNSSSGDAAELPGTSAAAAAATPTVATSSGKTAPGAAKVPGMSFAFTLSAPRTTSAGVYRSDGTLVRTLWRGEHMAAGSYKRIWDQLDDGGARATAGDYHFKVVHHNLQYIWEGVIGNTSAQAGAAVLHRSYLGPTSLAPVAGGMFYAVGYNEGQSGINGFRLANPQLNQSTVRLTDSFIGAAMIATDGQRLYWANTGGMVRKSFVAAFDVASGAQSVFSAGTAVCLNYRSGSTTCYPEQYHQSVLELRNTLDSVPTGIAVQKNGRILAVAYGADNAVRLYDKTSGLLLRVLSVSLAATGLNQIAIAPNGDLWVISGRSALRYAALAAEPVLAATIGPLVKPLAIAVDAQDDDAVWLADGGASQQIHRFNSVGVLQQTIGRAGGCASSVQVSTDRLCFQRAPGVEQTAIGVDDKRALWVVDTGNNRMLALAPDGSVSNQIAYLPVVYMATVDSGNPTRVFANYLEFAVDYSKPLTDSRSWTLLRNWLPALPAALRDAGSTNAGFGGFRTVQTLSNGRTYALISVNNKPAIVELTAGGQVRPVATLRSAASGETPVVLYENGDLGYSATDSSRQSVLRLPLQGFDASGNPLWAKSPVVIAAAPLGAGAPTFPAGTWTGATGARFPITDSGKVVYFSASPDASSGFHLGAVASGATSWLWQASPSGPLDGLGTFQTHASDPKLQYAGNLVYAVGRAIVYGYHGEGYTDLGNGRYGQANQFMHFRDDGMFIGQFGVASTRATSTSQPGLSGNAFSPTLVRAAGQTYLYHNDESSHGGVHRWRLDGVDDIRELVGTGSIGSTIRLR
jgi:hypothetical protein